MDIFSHIFVAKICNVCLKRPKINENEAVVGPFYKKKLLEKLELLFIFWTCGHTEHMSRILLAYLWTRALDTETQDQIFKEKSRIILCNSGFWAYRLVVSYRTANQKALNEHKSVHVRDFYALQWKLKTIRNYELPIYVEKVLKTSQLTKL